MLIYISRTAVHILFLVGDLGHPECPVSWPSLSVYKYIARIYSSLPMSDRTVRPNQLSDNNMQKVQGRGRAGWGVVFLPHSNKVYVLLRAQPCVILFRTQLVVHAYMQIYTNPILVKKVLREVFSKPTVKTDIRRVDRPVEVASCF